MSKSTLRCQCGAEIEITDQLDADLRLIADAQAAEINRLQEDCECYEAMKDGVAERIADLEAELNKLRDAVAYLRPRMVVYQGQLMCPQKTWHEFERRISG